MGGGGGGGAMFVILLLQLVYFPTSLINLLVLFIAPLEAVK